jgi:glycerol-3-phosphate acyltransferase PlsY
MGVAVVISLLVLVRHEGNIRRLATGNETTWSGPGPGGDPDGSPG